MTSLFEKRANNAIRLNDNTVNGRTADIAITTHGSDWYFAVCAVMTVATFAFLGLGFMKPRSHRLFHYITAAITMVAAVAYFTMGSNLGFTPIAVEFHRSAHIVSGNYREIFYVRYIDWFITTPLLLLDLLLTAGIPWPTMLFIILVDELMIVTGLVGALVQSSYKWGYFVFAMFALFYIIYHLAWESRRNANRISPEVGRAFLMCGTLTLFLWTLYPIAWGVSEGGNVIAPDSEAVFYGVLDLLAKPVFGALLLFGHRNIDPAVLGLRIRDYDDDTAVHGGARSEKVGHHNGVGATNGVSGTNGVGHTGTGVGTGAGTGYDTGVGHTGTGVGHTGTGVGTGYDTGVGHTGVGHTGVGHTGATNGAVATEPGINV